jgi:hypothetical protein
MNALQIALALAVSMLIFSTLATMVVEMLHKVLRTRRMGLRKMLSVFYESEVKGRINGILSKDGTATEDLSEFIGKITLKSGDSSVTTMEFIRRFADTEIGKCIARRADSQVNVLIDEIVETYEEFGRQASKQFRRYSQIGTIVVSIIVALCLNINILIIFQTFQSNEKLTRAVALQAEQAMATYQIQAELLKTAMTNTDTDRSDLDDGIEDLKGNVQKFRDSVAAAQALGLPIGWSDGEIFNRKDIDRLGIVFWILTTMLTGFLIGLGGPFWFDVVKRLTPVSQLAGALVRQPAAKTDSGPSAVSETGATAVVLEDPKAAFKTVIRANRIIDQMDTEGSGFLGPKGIRL